MIYLLAWPGGLAIGLSLGMLGSGGSILTVPVLVYLVGQPEKLAIAGSLAIVGLISMAASLPYIRAHQVDWRYVLLFGVPGMVGSFAGSTFAHRIPQEKLRRTFGIFLIVMGGFILYQSAPGLLS